jgi:flagellar biosynthetic protein FliP
VRKKILVAAVLILLAAAGAQAAVDNALSGLIEPKRMSVLLETMLALTFISFVPALLVMTTSFLRFIVALGFLRHALGTQQTPPNQVLLGLALILTLFVMGPTWQRVKEEALVPYQQKTLNWNQALDKASLPMKDFMLRQVRKKDLAAVFRISRQPVPQDPAQSPFSVLTMAYVLSELKTSFEIGFVIFLPFLVVDMVVSSALMSLGMMMVPPTVISLPLKILLFVMVDGWTLLVQGLAMSVR